MVGEGAGAHEGGDLLRERLADPLEAREAALPDQVVHLVLEAPEGAGGVEVGAALERVLALDLEEGGDLLEDVRDFAVVHRILATVPC